MKTIKKTLATAAGVAAFTAAGVAGAGSASALGSCVPVGTYVGGVTVTICIAVDTPPAGYPSVGAYVAPHGYVEVCTTSGCTHEPFSFDATGVAIVPVNQASIATSSGTPIPNTCVSGICTPPTLPGYEITLFSDSGVLLYKIDGSGSKIDVPEVCLSTSGTC